MLFILSLSYFFKEERRNNKPGMNITDGLQVGTSCFIYYKSLQISTKIYNYLQIHYIVFVKIMQQILITFGNYRILTQFFLNLPNLCKQSKKGTFLLKYNHYYFYFHMFSFAITLLI